MLAAAFASTQARAEDAPRAVIAFANATDDPGTRLEGTGFTGADVRGGFALAARRLPLDLVLYDNRLDRAAALANVRDAVARRVDAYVLYGWDEASARAKALAAERRVARLAVHNWTLASRVAWYARPLPVQVLDGRPGQFGLWFGEMPAGADALVLDWSLMSRPM